MAGSDASDFEISETEGRGPSRPRGKRNAEKGRRDPVRPLCRAQRLIEQIKRREQNRSAQRAFRARQAQVPGLTLLTCADAVQKGRVLEDRIAELEETVQRQVPRRSSSRL